MTSNQIELSNSVNTVEKTKSSDKIKKEGYSKVELDENINEEDNIQIEREKIVSYQYDDFSISTPISIDKPKSFCYKKIGNMFTFCGDKDGNPLIMIGPHWPMYVCFSSILSGLLFLFFFGFWIHLNFIFKLLGILIYSTFILSYTYTFLINPGYPKNNLESQNGEPRNKFRYCERCKIWVNIEKKTNHCFECDICIEWYDHHCPWTGKCIGKRNATSFYIFLVSVLLVVGYMVCALVNAQINKGKINKL